MGKKKRGRPKLPKGKVQKAVVTVRMSQQEREVIGDAAKAAGVQKLSEWIRQTLLAAANPAKLNKTEDGGIEPHAGEAAP